MNKDTKSKKSEENGLLQLIYQKKLTQNQKDNKQKITPNKENIKFSTKKRSTFIGCDITELFAKGETAKTTSFIYVHNANLSENC